MGPLASRPKSRGPILMGGRPERQPLADPVRSIDTQQLIDGVLALARGQSPMSPEEQQARAWGVKDYDPARTYCPPAPYFITGIGPDQVRDSETSYTRQKGRDVAPGGVAIRPQGFIARDGDWQKYQDQLRQVTFESLWDQAIRPSNGAPGRPTGLPSEGPYFAVGNIGGPQNRIPIPHHIDLFGYQDPDQAAASKRTAPVIRSFPRTAKDLRCL